MILSTGWRRPIGYLRLQVIFHKRATNYRALLHKMTYKHKASCGSSPPCILIITVFCKESKHLDTYRVARRLIGSLICIGHFSQKWPEFGGSFVENYLQLVGSCESSPPCTMHGANTWRLQSMSQILIMQDFDDIEYFDHYGVATISRHLKIMYVFCKRAL